MAAHRVDIHSWLLAAFFLILTIWSFMDRQPFFLLLSALGLGYSVRKVENE